MALRLLGSGPILVASLLASACTTPADKAGSDSSDTATPTTGAGGLGFTPANIDLTGFDLGSVGDFVVDNDECSINSDENLASCGDGANVLGFRIETQSDGTSVAVYVARSMTILADQNLAVVGSLPLVFVALDSITITGTLDANSAQNLDSVGGQAQLTEDTQGGGPGGGGAGTATAAGGGGSYCGAGGAGAAESGAGPAGGATWGTPTSRRSSGARRAARATGTPGAAAAACSWSPAARSRSTPPGRSTSAAAAAGSAGSADRRPTAAAAAGRSCSRRRRCRSPGRSRPTAAAAARERPTAPGRPHPTIRAARTRRPTPPRPPAARPASDPPRAATGAPEPRFDGAPGAFTASNAAGAGGGGAGRIRIDTESGQATLGGTISPAESTPCVTQGVVR